jgi:hypothetical protein
LDRHLFGNGFLIVVYTSTNSFVTMDVGARGAAQIVGMRRKVF